MKSILLFFATLTLEKKALLLILTPTFAALLNIKSILLGLLIVILIDLVTGIKKSLYNKGVSNSPFKKYFWQTLSSTGLRATWKKVSEYGIGILIFVIFETMILKLQPIQFIGQEFTLAGIAAVIAFIIEMWSIFENMEAVSGNNMLKRILNFLPKPIKNMFESLGKNKDNE